MRQLPRGVRGYAKRRRLLILKDCVEVTTPLKQVHQEMNSSRGTVTLQSFKRKMHSGWLSTHGARRRHVAMIPEVAVVLFNTKVTAIYETRGLASYLWREPNQAKPLADIVICPVAKRPAIKLKRTIPNAICVSLHQ